MNKIINLRLHEQHAGKFNISYNGADISSIMNAAQAGIGDGSYSAFFSGGWVDVYLLFPKNGEKPLQDAAGNYIKAAYLGNIEETDDGCIVADGVDITSICTFHNPDKHDSFGEAHCFIYDIYPFQPNHLRINNQDEVMWGRLYGDVEVSKKGNWLTRLKTTFALWLWEKVSDWASFYVND